MSLPEQQQVTDDQLSSLLYSIQTKKIKTFYLFLNTIQNYLELPGQYWFSEYCCYILLIFLEEYPRYPFAHTYYVHLFKHVISQKESRSNFYPFLRLPKSYLFLFQV